MRQRNRLGIFYRLLFALAAVAAGVGFVAYTDEVRETAGHAAAMCIELILPSLFPFLVLSNFLIGMGYVRSAGKYFVRAMRRIFNLSGACAGPFLMGVIGGYPVGAKSAVALYESGQCTRTECERMLSFCNNSGPAFIFGVVGAGIFSSSKTGLILYAAHVLASVSVGMIFRFYKKNETAGGVRQAAVYETPQFSPVFTSSVTQALASVGNISAFIIFFAIAADLLFTCGIFSFLEKVLAALLSPLGVPGAGIRHILVGLLEMTAGLGELSAAAESMNARLCMAAFMLGWAGISVHCQVLSFISSGGLSLKPYFVGKLLHGVFSALYMYLFLSASSAAVPTVASAQAEILSAVSTQKIVIQSLIGCTVTSLIILFPHIRDFFHRRI